MRFPWTKKQPLIPAEDTRMVINAIRHAEQQTSGEIRVFIETKCSWMDALDRAAEVFFELKMDKTEQHNAVLIYIALKDHQVALFGDQGIHKKVGSGYWSTLVGEMIAGFANDNYGKSISECVIQIGDALKFHFPYDKQTDKNELPDEIVFGR